MVQVKQERVSLTDGLHIKIRAMTDVDIHSMKYARGQDQGACRPSMPETLCNQSSKNANQRSKALFLHDIQKQRCCV